MPGLFYFAGNKGGLSVLANRIGQSIFKPGVTEAESPLLRMGNLAACRYGSCVHLAGKWIEEPGFDHFEAAALPLQPRRGRCSPVRPALRSIAFDRPMSLPFGTLDKAIRDSLAPASLQAFAQSPAGIALCQTRGLDPLVLDRYTPATLGRSARARPRRATELVIGVGPRAVADPIADLIERLIADHVMRRKA